MFRDLYDWIQNIAVYLILVSAVMHAIPGKDYEKYIRFFSGLILILLLFTPLLNLTGMAEEFTSLYKSREYEMDRKEIEDAEESSGMRIFWTLSRKNTGDIWKTRKMRRTEAG